MAIHGKNTEVWLNGVDVSEFFNNVDFQHDVDTAETTTFKKDWKTHIPGAIGATVELSGLYDPTLTSVASTLSSVDTGSSLVIYPDGSAVGKPFRGVTVKSTSYAESSPIGDVVAFSWSVIADGAVSHGYVEP